MIDSTTLANARVNLREAAVLCVDDSDQGLQILSQILMGFGVQKILKATSADECRAILSEDAVDVLLINASVGGNQGYDLVRWLRRSKLEPNRFTPTIVLSGHTVRSQVMAARDCGANFVVSKPVSSTVILERLMWISRSKRLFVEGASYVGPDRRFKNVGVPPGMEGRRMSDLAEDIGTQTDPNLTQTDINSLFRPQKVPS